MPKTTYVFISQGMVIKVDPTQCIVGLFGLLKAHDIVASQEEFQNIYNLDFLREIKPKVDNFHVGKYKPALPKDFASLSLEAQEEASYIQLQAEQNAFKDDHFASVIARVPEKH